MTQLKNGGFVRHVCAYVASLGDGDEATEIEDPVVFERTSNQRLEIQSEGTQVHLDRDTRVRRGAGRGTGGRLDLLSALRSQKNLRAMEEDVCWLAHGLNV